MTRFTCSRHGSRPTRSVRADRLPLRARRSERVNTAAAIAEQLQRRVEMGDTRAWRTRLTLYMPRFSTVQVKMASRPTETVRLFNGLPNLGKSATRKALHLSTPSRRTLYITAVHILTLSFTYLLLLILITPSTRPAATRRDPRDPALARPVGVHEFAKCFRNSPVNGAS